jgi:hypothetical protein
MTKKADLKRRVRVRMAKTGESYAAARAQLLRDHSRLPTALHVTNGDSAAGTLRETDLARRVLPWRDALHEGPVPASASDRELRRVRADFLARETATQPDEILRWLEHRDETLAENRAGDYVLWFEADLYDQLQLIEILGKLGALGVSPNSITLICIGEYLGIAHFGGLGQLAPEQLQGLPATAASPLTADGMELAAVAWAALRAEHPGGLGTIAKTHSRELRFLAEAFDRLSREYPSTRDGLSLTERRVLAAAAGGAGTAGEVHARLGAREARPFLGDLWCFRIVDRLARGRTPLLEAAAEVTATTPLRLTPAGLSVLDGEADHVVLNGIDRWIGGVNLVGDEARWRWNEGTESISESPA